MSVTYNFSLTTKELSTLAGYTKEVIVSNGDTDLHLFIAPDEDMEGEFVAYDADEGEFIRVMGWLISDIELIG